MGHPGMRGRRGREEEEGGAPVWRGVEEKGQQWREGVIRVHPARVWTTASLLHCCLPAGWLARCGAYTPLPAPFPAPFPTPSVLPPHSPRAARPAASAQNARRS